MVVNEQISQPTVIPGNYDNAMFTVSDVICWTALRLLLVNLVDVLWLQNVDIREN